MTGNYVSHLTQDVYLILILRPPFAFVWMFDGVEIWYTLGGFSQGFGTFTKLTWNRPGPRNLSRDRIRDNDNENFKKIHRWKAENVNFLIMESIRAGAIILDE